MNSIKYKRNDIELDIKFSPEENTIWMSQKDVSTLFKRNKKTINNHLSKITKNGSVVSRNETTEIDGKKYDVVYYNLDIIKQVGYKIDPFFTDSFVAWVKEELNKLNNQKIPIQSNIIRFDNGNVVLDVTVEPLEDTVYLDKEQLIILFDTTRQNIEYHINNIYDSGELDYAPTCKEILQVQKEGDREVTRTIIMYNLDLIISLGFRINNKKGIEFRRWANRVLRSYLYNGYVIDENRIRIIESNYVYMKSEIDEIKKTIEEHNKLISLKQEHEVVFFQGQMFDAYDFFCDLISKANKRIIIIDPYVDEVVLSIIKNKKSCVQATIITTNRCTINDEDLEKYQKQYGLIKIIKKHKFHHRNILIDDELYLADSSFNRAGHNQITITTYDKEDNIKMIKQEIEETLK